MKRNFYTFFVLVFLISSVHSLQAQLAWENIGPDNIGSVTRSLAFASNGDLLAGSQGGGLWRSTNEGLSWQRESSYDDAGGNPNITDILVDGATIYVATGAAEWEKPYARDVLNINASTYDWRMTSSGFKGNLDGLPGGGVYKFDGTWQTENGTNSGSTGSGTATYDGAFTSIFRLAKSKISNRIFIATRNGLYYSDPDLANPVRTGGSSFFRNNSIIDVATAADGVVFALALKDNQSSGVDSLFFSTDDGLTFRPVVNETEPIIQNGGSPFGFEGGRIAVAPSDPTIVYVASSTASLEVGGIFQFKLTGNPNAPFSITRKGPRGGTGFSPLGNNGKEAFVLEVFPDNPDELIVAGSNWYTFLEGRGWTQTAQHFFPQFPDFLGPYIPRSQYDVVFDPNNPNIMYVGTSQQIVRSEDRGESFSFRSFGYESTVAYSVGSFKIDVIGDEPESYDAVFGGSGVHGILYNGHYNSDREAVRQRFGSVSPINYSRAIPSALHPGGMLIQGRDGGLLRSLSFGASFEPFYGASISPQIDSLIIPPSVDTLIDRANDAAAGGSLYNGPVVAQSVFALDEYIPESFIEKDSITDEEAKELGSHIYFCSKNYVWLVTGGFGDPIQVKWNRITNELADGIEEYLTAITVSDDGLHTVYVGSNMGRIWRIDGANDLEELDAKQDVHLLITDPILSQLGQFMDGQSISALAIDPQNTNRLIVAFSGFGGSTPQSYLWAADSARDSNTPGFRSLTNADRYHKDLIHDIEYVIENDESVLLVGGQKGLYSVRGIALDPNNPFTVGTFVTGDYAWPNYDNGAITWTEESAAIGPVPVYDIYVRKYAVQITEGKLPKTIIVDGQSVETRKNELRINRDQTIFVATHGRGFWSSSSLSLGRQGGEIEPELTILESEISLYPNPTQDIANIEVKLTDYSTVTVDVFGVDGRRVATRTGGYPAGSEVLRFDTQDLVPGMYIFRVQISNDKGEITKNIKAMITK